MGGGLLAALAVLFLASLWLRPAWKVAFASLWLILVVTVYALDIALANSWLAGPVEPLWGLDQVSYADRMRFVRLGRSRGVEIDTRSPVEVLDELRARNLQAVLASMLGGRVVHEARDQSSQTARLTLLPLGGVSNALTVLCNESGRYVTYDSDERGFRNPRGVWNSSRADMAAVGQSLVQGYCVPNGTGFVDLLRQRYPVTLNLGMSGEGALLQLAAIKEFLPPYEPPIVLWFFSEGLDLGDVPYEGQHPWLKRYLEPSFSQRLLTRQPESDGLFQRAASEEEMRLRQRKPAHPSSSFIERSEEIIKLWDLRRALSLTYGIDSGGIVSEAPSATALDLLSKALEQAQQVTRGWGGTLYFVYLPSCSRYLNGPRVSERERTKVLRVAQALGIPIVDVEPAFRKHEDPLSLFPFRRFGHYNEAGNQLVAAMVLRSISGVR
jgi:hypothetical protein